MLMSGSSGDTAPSPVPAVVLVALALAFAYAFGLVSYSLTFRLFQHGIEPRSRRRIVEQYLTRLRPHAGIIDGLGATLPPGDTVSDDDAYDVVAAIHPYVSQHSKSGSSELLYRRRLFRMARGAALPAFFWCLLSGYWLIQLLTHELSFWPAPYFVDGIDDAVALLLGSLLLLGGVVITARIQTEQFAKYAVRHFLGCVSTQSRMQGFE